MLPRYRHSCPLSRVGPFVFTVPLKCFLNRYVHPHQKDIDVYQKFIYVDLVYVFFYVIGIFTLSLVMWRGFIVQILLDTYWFYGTVPQR